MRAWFHPTTGLMYACGMNAWGSNRTERRGGLLRILYTGAETLLPIGLEAKESGMTLRFNQPVDSELARDPKNDLVDSWRLKRSANDGSRLYDGKSLVVDSVEVCGDGRSVRLRLPEIS
ncbi:hypothetical protein FF011L_25940 [Roseimaritima multifibrata]|uniref:Uncharacterized protein n=2 Tax=Roseimaritima multifibrata TaxID=1930274 RepID=A0A517MG08_9BACT|nr:hypothetical protein FF011L_25940 [Roseimaritima multifibrata]